MVSDVQFDDPPPPLLLSLPQPPPSSARDANAAPEKARALLMCTMAATLLGARHRSKSISRWDPSAILMARASAVWCHHMRGVDEARAALSAGATRGRARGLVRARGARAGLHAVGDQPADRRAGAHRRRAARAPADGPGDGR